MGSPHDGTTAAQAAVVSQISRNRPKAPAKLFVNAEKMSLLHCSLQRELESLVSGNTGKHRI